MTFPQNLLDTIYTGKEGKLTTYGNLDRLETLGKYDLIRFDKISDLGISLTLCTVATTRFESRVSKAGQEKGIQPVTVQPSEPILFSMQISPKDRDGKDNPDWLLANQLISVFTFKNLKEGEIYFFNMDMCSIAPKTSERLLKAICEDFVFLKADDVDISKLGQDKEAWEAAVYNISGSVYVEPKGYAPKKTKDAIFRENIAAVEAITSNDCHAAYNAVYGKYCGDDEAFEHFCINLKNEILFSF